MSKIDLVLLGLLMECERHGYDILQEIERRSMKEWVGVSTQGVYKGLARLEAKGLLTVRTESGDGHPNRNIYGITPEGIAHFQALAVRAIGEPVKPHFPLLWGIGFAHLLDREALLEALDRRREQKREIRKLLDEYGREQEDCDHPMMADAIVDYYKELVEMETAWLTRLQRRIKRIKKWPEGAFKR